MNQTLQNRLRERFPALLCDPPPEYSPIGERGIEVADGWFDLLVTAFTDIEYAATNAGIAVPPLMQVKERCGLLRINVRKSGDRPSYDAFHEALDAVRLRYEAASATICECCGKPGALVDRPGAMRVRCELGP